MIKKSKNFFDFEDGFESSPQQSSKKIPPARICAIPNGYLIPIMILLTTAVVFIASLLILPRVVVYDVGTVSGSGSSERAETPQSGETSDSGIRVFREYNGRIGVFTESGELDFVIDVPISSLPEYDRKLISSGIIAQGAEQIAAIKEALSP